MANRENVTDYLARLGIFYMYCTQKLFGEFLLTNNNVSAPTESLSVSVSGFPVWAEKGSSRCDPAQDKSKL